ncbi:unnamed protein product [Cyprideis torosa]|uniref:peptidylprolyl isomerase n=1 Tax=Cyprideis torosa TaxID=163714 RepID=A0A7R8ZLK3_9CRUS|nr:unnamed protein product [Cyprideis torosa]CAG0893414.1 unnamed protein product [Cyprideis torosa]
MKVGESKQVNIPADKAYGPVREDAMVPVPRDQFPPEIDPQIGQQLEVTNAQGGRQIVKIVKIEEDQVILDANHPLAGQELIFDIELMEVS